MHLDLTNCTVDSHVSIPNHAIQVVNDMGKREVTPDGIQFRNIHHKSIILGLFVDNDLDNNDSYASDADHKIRREPETDLKKIEFNIDVKDDKINDLNNKDTVHFKDGLADDKNTDIKGSGVQYKQDARRNRCCTPVKNELQLSNQLGGHNEAND